MRLRETRREKLLRKREKIDIDLQLGLITYEEAKKRLEKLNKKEE